MRTSSSPSLSRARPIWSVETRRRVARKGRSHSSIASHRSSSGDRFQRSHLRHTTQSRPFAASNANRLPTGNDSTTSFVPRLALQKRQVEYTSQRYGAYYKPERRRWRAALIDTSRRHSYLIATAGSTLAALRAGNQLARIATPSSPSATATNVSGSVAPTP